MHRLATKRNTKNEPHQSPNTHVTAFVRPPVGTVPFAAPADTCADTASADCSVRAEVCGLRICTRYDRLSQQQLSFLSFFAWVADTATAVEFLSICYNCEWLGRSTNTSSCQRTVSTIGYRSDFQWLCTFLAAKICGRGFIMVYTIRLFYDGNATRNDRRWLYTMLCLVY